MQLCHCGHHNAPDLQHLTFFQVKRGIVFISGFEGILAVLDAQLLVGQDDDRQTLQAWVEGPFTGDIEVIAIDECKQVLLYINAVVSATDHK